MKDHYYSLFQSLPREPIPDGLHERIVSEITLLEKRVAFVRRFSFTMVTVAFFSAFIPTMNFLIAQFANSSFTSYASLLVTDGDIAILHSQEFLFSMAESLPILGITLALTLILLLLGAMRFVATNSRQATKFITTRTA